MPDTSEDLNILRTCSLSTFVEEREQSVRFLENLDKTSQSIVKINIYNEVVSNCRKANSFCYFFLRRSDPFS